MKRAALVLAALIITVPAIGSAEGTLYAAPYDGIGQQGGDQWNRIQADPQTGEMSIVRYSMNAPFSGGLGCGGQGGYVSFAVTHPSSGPVNTVIVAYDDAFLGPYAFLNITIRKDDGSIAGLTRRGVFSNDGSVSVSLPAGTTGPLTAWFGLQVSSACPPGVPFEYAQATFTAVVFR